MSTVIAHEVAHGAFRLKHPESEFGIAMSDNLMHNANDTNLRKYQWDNIHDPEAMSSWLQDDDESALTFDPSVDSFNIMVGQIPTEFAPGKDVLEVNYEIKNLTQLIEKYPDEVFKVSLEIRDNSNNLVLSRAMPLKEEGVFKWSGSINDQGVVINNSIPDDASWSFSDLTLTELELIKFSDGPYNLAVSAFAGPEDEWGQFWDCFWDIDCLIGDEVTNISDVEKVNFILDKDFELWKDFDFSDYVAGEYEDYKNDKDVYEGVLVLDDEETALEHLTNNLVKTSFLGTEVVLHKRFIYILNQVIDDIGIAHYSSISNSPSISDFRIKRSLSNTSYISNHRLGFALDLNAMQNPQLYDSDQKQILEFLEIATEYIFRTTRVSVSDSYKAQSNFKERILDVNKTISTVNTSINTVGQLLTDEDSYQLSEIKNDQINIDLNLIIDNVLNSSNINLFDPVRLDELNSKLEKSEALLVALKAGFLIDHQFNSETKKLEEIIESATEKLESIQTKVSEFGFTDGVFNGSGIEELKSTMDCLLVSNIENHINTLKDKIGTLSTFANSLQSKIVNDGSGFRGKNIFAYGFLNVDKELTEAFYGNQYIRWGGRYKTSKDWMHFEVTPTKVSDLFDVNETDIEAAVEEYLNRQ